MVGLFATRERVNAKLIAMKLVVNKKFVANKAPVTLLVFCYVCSVVRYA